MKNKNIQNIMLVTYDPFGIPANVKCESGITNSTRADRVFMDYLQAERNAALGAGFFPDLRVCRYDPGTEIPGPDILHDPQRLQEFIRERCPLPSSDFSLRRFDALQYVLKDIEDTRDLQRLKQYMDPGIELREDIREILDRCMEDLQDDSSANLLQVVETAQGALLLPYADYPNRLRSFLQYVADHYFTPTARQLGHIRMYSTAVPGQDMQDAASRAGYMFAPDNGQFLAEKARWYPADMLQDNRMRGMQGVYTLRPTYHDFHYFIEDNGLQVSPRNNELFTLIFIAEYGCPQNFQRDPVYADHPDRRAFVRLDRQLEEAKEKSPGGDERFYRIQHRQQLLARDILRDKYGIVIPEPQLTGPSRLQESKQTQKQGIKPRKTNLKL